MDNNVSARARSRCLGVKTLRVGNGNTNLRVQQSLEIVNLESEALWSFVKKFPGFVFKHSDSVNPVWTWRIRGWLSPR